MKDFGIIIACCDQDYMFAQGTCASIRHFLGDVPICLIIDGTFSVEPLRKAYGIHVINRNNVSNPLLRERSFGWGLTKMVAFWESPFEHFLFLDADTNVWGNVLKYADFENHDVVIDKPRYEAEFTDQEVNHFFFDTAGLEKIFPSFDWRKHRNKYFCTGTFFATRGIFTVEEYIEILDLNSRTPIFKFGEMGMLNFMLCRAEEEGRIKIGQESMQIIVPDFSQSDLKKRFPVAGVGPVVDDEDVVIHWCGPKPTSMTKLAYADPMTFSRLKFIQDSWGVNGLMANLLLKIGDVQHYFLYYKNKMRKKWRLATKFLTKKLRFRTVQIVSVASP